MPFELSPPLAKLTPRTALFPDQERMESSTKKISKRSRKGRDKHRSRGLDLGYVKAAPTKELEEQPGAAQCVR